LTTGAAEATLAGILELGAGRTSFWPGSLDKNLANE
jgi:hypothetical protein